MGGRDVRAGRNEVDLEPIGPTARRPIPGKRTRTSELGPRSPTAVANESLAGAGDSLPFGAAIQASFGKHDVSDVRTRTGDEASDGADALGASAFAFGSRIGFAETPDLHTAAHEAAHVVQQRGGVSLYGGVGESGDVYEKHADQVADLVVAGQSAEAALDRIPGSGSSRPVVQKLDKEQPAAAEELDAGAADSAITAATRAMLSFGREVNVSAAEPWAGAVDEIRIVCQGGDTPVDIQLERFETAVDALRSARPLATEEHRAQYDSSVVETRAQLSISAEVELRSEAAQIDATCSRLLEVDVLASAMAAAAVANGLAPNGVEVDWKPVTFTLEADKGPQPFAIPDRDSLGAGLKAIQAVAVLWKAGKTLATKNPQDSLKNKAEIAKAIFDLADGLFGVALPIMEQAAANAKNENTRKALADAAGGLGKSKMALSTVGGTAFDIFCLVDNVGKLLDASLPVFERVDAGVGAVGSLLSIAGRVAGFAESVTTGQTAFMAAEGAAAFGAGALALGVVWGMTKIYITEFPKLEAVSRSMVTKDVQAVADFAAEIGRLGDRVAVADQMDSTEGATEELTAAKHQAADTLRAHIQGYSYKARWFESFGELAEEQIKYSGIEAAKSPRDVIVCAETVLVGLTALIESAPALLREQLGLDPREGEVPAECDPPEEEAE